MVIKPPASEVMARALDSLLASTRDAEGEMSMHTDLSSTFARIQTHLQALRIIRISFVNEIAEQERTLKATASCLSPFNRLPFELQMMVFLEDLETQFGQPSERKSRRTTLSLVSTLWQQLILRTPAFWTDIDLGQPDVGLKKALNLSGALPLHVHWNISDRQGATDDPYVQVSQVVGQARERVQTMTLISYKSDLLLPLLGAKLPALESLVLQNHDTEHTPNSTAVNVSGGPRLQELYTANLFINFRAANMSGLTFFDCSGAEVMVAQLLAMAESCPVLENLTLSDIRSSDPGSPLRLETKKIEVGSLRELHLEWMDPQLALPFLAALRADNLIRFRWENDSSEEIPFATAQRFLRKTSLLSSVVTNTSPRRIEISCDESARLLGLGDDVNIDFCSSMKESVLCLLDLFPPPQTTIPSLLIVDAPFLLKIPLALLPGLVDIQVIGVKSSDYAKQVKLLGSFLKKLATNVKICPVLAKLNMEYFLYEVTNTLSRRFSNLLEARQGLRVSIEGVEVEIDEESD